MTYCCCYCRRRTTAWISRFLQALRLVGFVALVLSWGITISATSVTSQQYEEVETTTVTPLTAMSQQSSSPPVIGVVSQPLNDKTRNSSVFYIAASYVKWLESGGARTIAIPYDASPSLLNELLTQIHLLFLPGGDAPMAPSIQYLLTKIDQLNAGGGGAVEHHHHHHKKNNTPIPPSKTTTWFPVWGTCLGLEFLLSHFGNIQPYLRETFDAENMSVPLYNVVTSSSSFPTRNNQTSSSTSSSPRYHKSLYSNRQLYDIVTTRAVTLNNHKRGISPKEFRSNSKLNQIWQIASTNTDRNGKLFVSTIEPINIRRYPYWGVQYHPEKNAFEYGMYPHTTIPYEVIDHSPQGVRFSNLMARQVVKLARISQQHNGKQHQYTQPTRFPPVHTYPIQVGVAFEQVYLIPPASYFERPDLSGTTSSGNVAPM